jgi:aminopeptidase YwaD
MFLPLLLAAGAGIDGEAALQHAARLSALGPHPWGSAVGRGAAQYVASQLRDAGLADVQLQEFEAAGVRGVNVVGTRPGAGRGVVIVGAHHDTAPDAPGAYDDSGGVGVVIEVARAMAKEGPRGRTLMFVSFDGEEAWSQGAFCTGSRAFLERLGARSRDVIGAVIVEMSGWRGGTPTLLPIAYADPLQPGETVIAPAWLVRAAVDGARAGFPGTALGDRYVGWLHQPAVRAVRVQYYGDDVSFLQRGVPAILASDSSFSAFYPWYHTAQDTVDKLDAGALGRMGAAILGAARALETAVPEEPETEWFGAFGHVVERKAILAAGVVSLLPLLWAARGAGGFWLGLRALHAAAFGVVLWRQPVVAVWCFALSHLLAPLGARPGVRVAALAPLLALLGLVGAAHAKGMAGGTWLAAWELGLGVFVALAALVPVKPAAPAPRKSGKAGRRRGLPKR